MLEKGLSYDDVDVKRKRFLLSNVLQEIHNKISIEMGVKPSHVILADFKENEKLCEGDLYDVDPLTHHLFLNITPDMFKHTSCDSLLQYLYTITYQNGIRRQIENAINDEQFSQLKDEELFLVLYQAIHRYNSYSMKEKGFEPEVEYLTHLEDLDCLDIFSNIYATVQIQKDLSKLSEYKDRYETLKGECADYYDYIKNELLLKSMRVAKIEMIAFLTKNDFIPKKIKQLCLKCFQELGNSFFKKCGAEINDGENWLDYLNFKDARFVLNNANWIEDYVPKSMIKKLIEKREDYLTDEEFENVISQKPDSEIISDLTNTAYEKFGSFVASGYSSDEEIEDELEDMEENLYKITDDDYLDESLSDLDGGVEHDDIYELHTEFNKGLSDFLQNYNRDDSLFKKLSKYCLYFRDFSGISDKDFDPVENLPDLNI